MRIFIAAISAFVIGYPAFAKIKLDEFPKEEPKEQNESPFDLGERCIISVSRTDSLIIVLRGQLRIDRASMQVAKFIHAAALGGAKQTLAKLEEKVGRKVGILNPDKLQPTPDEIRKSRDQVVAVQKASRAETRETLEEIKEQRAELVTSCADTKDLVVEVDVSKLVDKMEQTASNEGIELTPNQRAEALQMLQRAQRIIVKAPPHKEDEGSNKPAQSNDVNAAN